MCTFNGKPMVSSEFVSLQLSFLKHNIILNNIEKDKIFEYLEK